jgi:transcriptional regulator with XRE-family HTH domain
MSKLQNNARTLSRLGHVLAVLRHRRGLSREELAEASALSVRTVERYEETGKTPSLKTLEAVLAALDCQLSDVFVAQDGRTTAVRAAERAELQAQVVDLHRRLDRVQKELLSEASRRATALARTLAEGALAEPDRERWLRETRAVAARLGELRDALSIEPAPSYAVSFEDLAQLDELPQLAARPAQRPAKAANDA